MMMMIIIIIIIVIIFSSPGGLSSCYGYTPKGMDASLFKGLCWSVCLVHVHDSLLLVRCRRMQMRLRALWGRSHRLWRLQPLRALSATAKSRTPAPSHSPW